MSDNLLISFTDNTAFAGKQTGVQAILDEIMADTAPPQKLVPATAPLTIKAILDKMIENPLITDEQLAAHFGVRRSYMRSIVSSDAFQAALTNATTQEDIARAANDLNGKIRATVQQAVETISTKLERGEVVNVDSLVNIVSRLGDKIGMGSAPPAATSNNTLQVYQQIVNHFQTNSK